MSRMPKFYLPPYGTPLYWADEQSGELRLAVSHFYSLTGGATREQIAAGIPPLTDQELALLLEYAVYHIMAPVWDSNPHADEEYWQWLEKVREIAINLSTLDHLRDYNDMCMESALDPF